MLDLTANVRQLGTDRHQSGVSAPKKGAVLGFDPCRFGIFRTQIGDDLRLQRFAQSGRIVDASCHLLHAFQSRPRLRRAQCNVCLTLMAAAAAVGRKLLAQIATGTLRPSVLFLQSFRRLAPRCFGSARPIPCRDFRPHTGHVMTMRLGRAREQYPTDLTVRTRISRK